MKFTPLIGTVPDILGRIVARKRDDLAQSAPPIAQWERDAEFRLPGRRDFRAALLSRTPAIIEARYPTPTATRPKSCASVVRHQGVAAVAARHASGPAGSTAFL